MRLFLNGGGSDNQITSAIEKMNDIIDHSRPLLYIPLAMDESVHTYDSCYEWVNRQLINVSIPRIDMVRTYEELANLNLEEYCAIFIGGGNTYEFLKNLKHSGSFDNLRNYINKNGIVFGGSAGSIIFGYDIDVVVEMDPNDVGLKDTLGFDVMNGISIFPHYTNRISKLTDQENDELHQRYTDSIVEFSMKVGPVIAYPEEDTLYINGDDMEVLGDRDYYYVENGNIVRYDINDDKKQLKLR